MRGRRYTGAVLRSPRPLTQPSPPAEPGEGLQAGTLRHVRNSLSPSALRGERAGWGVGVTQRGRRSCDEQAAPDPRGQHDLSLNTAADALGLSRRTMAHYRTGSRPIPHVVALACEALSARWAAKAA